jgi:hypothetical protein
MSPAADRRVRARFEVVGRLRGVLEVSEPVYVRNISATGALIETSLPAPVGSLRSLQLTVEGRSSQIKTSVRWTTKGVPESPDRYLLGVQFVQPSEDLADLVARVLAETQGE